MKLVPDAIRTASYALGANRMQTTLKVILPAALPAILTGVFLAVGRIAGETAPLLLTAAGSRFWPTGLSEPTPFLPKAIYDYSRSPDWNWLIFVYSFEAKARPTLVEEKHPLVWADLDNLDAYRIPESDRFLMGRLFDEGCSYLELAMEYRQAEVFVRCSAHFEGQGELFK